MYSTALLSVIFQGMPPLNPQIENFAKMSSLMPINVAFTTDANYVQHVGVTMMSILCNVKNDRPVRFTVIGDNLSEEDIFKLKQIVEKNNASVTFPGVQFEKFSGLKGHSYLSRSTYARFVLPDIINEDRVLYLDCDLLVRHDISPLWAIDVSDYYCGAVIAPFMNNKVGGIDHHKRLGVPPDTVFFNGGVLLLNLERCRKDNVMEKAFNFIQENPDKLHYRSQDGLNAVMSRNWLPLHPRWNVGSNMFRICYSSKLRKKYSSEIIEAVKDPAIVHYTGNIKPWHYACDVPYVEEYYKYLAMTPWKDYRPTGWTFRGMLRKNRRVFKRRLKSMMLGYRV